MAFSSSLDATDTNPHALNNAQDDDEIFHVMLPPPANFDMFLDTPRSTGMKKSRKLVHQDQEWHCSAHVWIVDPEKRLVLLQKRSAAKDTFPGRYDISAAGHLEADGAEPQETAVREVAEELGLTIKPEDLEFVFICPAEQAPWGGCNAYEHVYFLLRKRENCQFAIGSAEVTSVKWISINELKAAWKNGDEEYVPRVEQYKKAFFAKSKQVCLEASSS